ncbi:MAG: ketoacyl-ACP synthase III [Thermoanaerobaculales bacterium]|nr:ketoacyl-ACP synthase III [Thermoanaerobaculales bacterium]
MRAVITGAGMFVPPVVVTNDDYARVMDTTDEWIRQRTGIEERRLVEPGTATSDLGTEAGRIAIAEAGLEPSDIDYVIFATMTPDYYFPGPAPLLQHKLGLNQVPCLDIRQQCAGFIYALQVADAVIRSGQARHVLVVGAEVHSCFMPFKSWDVLLGKKDGPIPQDEYERNTATRDRTVLFGDGAGAVVISASEDEDRGLVDFVIHTDGSHAERLWTPAGGSAFRPYFTEEMIESGDITPYVDGRRVYALAVTNMPKVTIELLDRHNLKPEDLDLVIMHQANLRINEGVQKRLGLPDEKVFNNIQRYGNTTAGTIPIAFAEAKAQGRIKRGDLMCFIGLGSGLNWGAVLYRA